MQDKKKLGKKNIKKNVFKKLVGTVTFYRLLPLKCLIEKAHYSTEDVLVMAT